MVVVLRSRLVQWEAHRPLSPRGDALLVGGNGGKKDEAFLCVLDGHSDACLDPWVAMVEKHVDMRHGERGHF